ncbi:hypothetical protein MKW98_030477 [Papaver atlanticum]|uniref:Uncharacterized protein n=1 Tax=Papaver atlanticum TaxID=357466 RepID=A0AAD4SGT4_9MAGN|nr:hypothetical protein MKW98_030477 [Papaver atlanticum]
MKLQKKVSEAKAKRQEAGTSGSKSTVVSEVLEDVFGANRKDGIRGYSSSMSKKQAQVAAVAYSVLQTRQSQNEEKMNTIQTEVTSLGSRMGGVEGAVGSLNGKVDAILQLLRANGPAPESTSNTPRTVTPSPEKGSTTYPAGGSHRVLDNEEIGSCVVRSGQVELLNNRRQVVALGSIKGGSDDEYVHCVKVMPNERNVYVEEVYDQTAVIWDPPQGDGYHFLKQLPLPAFVRWGVNRLQPAVSLSF